jgi:hypothetical protein
VTQLNYYGCYLTGVADPDEEGTQGRQFLGRWTIEEWDGVLDIYRLPGLYALSPYDTNPVDHRIGTYFEDEEAWRVNGFVFGETLFFCIDFDDLNAPRDALNGIWHMASIYSIEDGILDGLAFFDDWIEEFQGARQTKTDWDIR